MAAAIRAGGGAAARRAPAAAGAVALAGSAPGAPMGMGAPPLASATRLVAPVAPVPAPSMTPAPSAVPAAVPAPAVAGGLAAAAQAPALEESAPDDTLLVAPATAAAARGNGHDRTAVVPPVAAAAATAPPASPPPSPPPRVQIRPEVAAARRPLPPPRPPAPPRFSLARRLIAGLVGILIVVAIVTGLLKATSGPNTPATHHPNRSHQHRKPAAHFIPSRVTVAVLNGTGVTHLAKDVSTRLNRAGYKQGTVANAAVQTHADTIVAYQPGHRVDAVHVARALRVPDRSIQQADHDALAMCSASATGGSNSCSAEVIVTVGTDLSSVASAAGSG